MPRPVPETAIFSAKIPRALIAEFTAAARAELGPMPRTSGDGAVRAVLERLLREYVAERKRRAEQDQLYPY